MQYITQLAIYRELFSLYVVCKYLKSEIFNFEILHSVLKYFTKS